MAGGRARRRFPLRHLFPFVFEASGTLTLTSATAFGELAGGFLGGANAAYPVRVEALAQAQGTAGSDRRQLREVRASPASRWFLGPPRDRLDRHAYRLSSEP